MEIDGHYLSIYTIERKIHMEDGTVHTIRTYLTPQGKILRHNWLDVPYILKLNPLVDPKIISKTIKITTPLRDRWKEDIEMFSKYLDVKVRDSLLAVYRNLNCRLRSFNSTPTSPSKRNTWQIIQK